jgi:isoleucyl-tRNA synthetase
LISNTGDFDEKISSVKPGDMQDIDQWILAKLNQLIEKVDGYYKEYELHQIYHAIYNFCVIELSAFYLDIQKDNLYCNAVDSKQRRSCQTALSMISRSLIVMLSPILAFSMEDVYRYLPGQKKTSVFLETYPTPVDVPKQETVLKRFEALLQIRVAVNAELEKKRQAKVIGSSLETAITLTTPDALTLEDLEKVLVVSRISIKKGAELSVDVQKSEGEKCLRCWKYDDLTPEGLCHRCHEVLNG